MPEPPLVPVTLVYVPMVLDASAPLKFVIVSAPPAGLTTILYVDPPPPVLATPVYVPGVLLAGTCTRLVILNILPPAPTPETVKYTSFCGEDAPVPCILLPGITILSPITYPVPALLIVAAVYVPFKYVILKLASTPTFP